MLFSRVPTAVVVAVAFCMLASRKMAFGQEPFNRKFLQMWESTDGSQVFPFLFR